MDPDAASYRRSPRLPASKKSSGAVAGGVATEVAGAGEKPPRRNVRGNDDGKDGFATGGNSSNDSSGSDDGRGSGRQGGSRRKDNRSHGGSRGAGEDCRDGGDSESSGGGESESRGRPERLESETGYTDQGSGTGDPRRRRRHRDDGRRDSGSSEEEDGRASSEGPALSPRKPPSRHGETPRKRTRTREGRGAASSDDGGGNKSVEGGSVGGKGRPGGPKAAVEYFPVNAGALCAAVEKVPENALCGHRYLAPLVDLVSTGEDASNVVVFRGPGALVSRSLLCCCAAAFWMHGSIWTDLSTTAWRRLFHLALYCCVPNSTGEPNGEGCPCAVPPA